MVSQKWRRVGCLFIVAADDAPPRFHLAAERCGDLTARHLPDRESDAAGTGSTMSAAGVVARNPLDTV